MQGTTSGPRILDAATASAVLDILAAMDSDAAFDEEPTQAAAPEQVVVGAPGQTIGHGAIRLRDQSITPETAAAGSTVSAVGAKVGHGTIRLRGQTPADRS